MFWRRYFVFCGIFVGLGTALCGAAGSAWAPGVSEQSGWLDVNKAYVPKSEEISTLKPGAGTDLSLCWAAQASNMLQFWQNAYVAAGNAISAGTPHGLIEGRENFKTRQYQIFEYFADNWTDLGGSSEYAVPWYLTGEFFFRLSDK